MEKTYNPSSIENKYHNLWEKKNLFSSNINTNSKKSYCIMLPPPNVTGSLHMGHAFQQTIMDILTRTHRMQGDKTLWQPGTDHAGIATQIVVERQLNAQGSSAKEIGRKEFIKKVWRWKKESGNTITNQMRRLGASVDWQKEKFTMDDDLSQAVNKVFIDLYNEGLIYRGKRLVNWDPVLQTAVSDLEVNNTDENGFMHTIKYPFVDGSGFMQIATTRPETMLADGALAVNPSDKRYTNVIGKKVWVPLCDRQIPIVADNYVDSEFETGCVKITPAHDFNDWEVGKRHQMEIINLFTLDAKMNENAPKAYQGMDRFVARKQILKDLEKTDLLVEIRPHKLTPPRGDRTGAILEPYLTDQWFVKTEALATDAINCIKNNDITFVPKNWEKTYFNWMENIEDWCISRQIWWGHRIPAYFDTDGNIFVANSLKEAQSQAGKNAVLTQDGDVLDTWFSSALWPFSTLGWPQNTQDFKDFYPTNVLVTGFDIIFFWVARMIMFGLKFTKKIPFKDIYITGLVRDGEGNKMSKSKGNVLDPLDIIDGITLENLLKKRTSGMMQPKLAAKIKKQTQKEFPQGINSYGTDALRFNFAANASFGRDIKFDLKRVEGYRNFCNKLWNAARFVFGNIDDIQKYKNTPTQLTTIDNWILSRLQQAKQSVNKYQKEYRFDLLANELYNFVWHDYCDWYLEFSKPTIDNDNTKHTLIKVLDEILKLLHPLIPFITEEIFTSFNSRKLLIEETYPQVDEILINTLAEEKILVIKEFVLGIRKIRADMNISPNKKLSCFIEGATSKFLESYKAIILQIAKLETLEAFIPNDKEYATAIAGDIKILIPLAGLVDKKQEIARLEKELEKLHKRVAIFNNKLSNKKFVTNAKPKIVQIERDRLNECSRKISSIETQLAKMNNLL